MVALLPAIALSQGAPPEYREALRKLERAGALVRIERPSGGKVEFWIDFNKPIQDGDLKPIRGLKPLTALRVLGGGFTDAGLKHIRGVPRLWLLVVRSAKITDAGVATIAGISTLRKLDIMEARLTARGLGHLRQLKGLEQLYLYSAVLPSSALKPLSGLTWLKSLDLPKSTTRRDLDWISKALPRTRVSVSP
jgi:hypothetical protein